MKMKWVLAGIVVLVLAAGSEVAALAGPEQAAQQQQTTYTVPEYNMYQAAANEKDAATRVKLLDDFVAKYPQSTLLPFAYRVYYLAYYELKNYGKTIEYADKLLALGDKIEIGTRIEAHAARAQAFFFGSSNRALLTPELLQKTREASADALQLLDKWTKAENITEQQFADQKKGLSTLINTVAGIAGMAGKDPKGAATSFRAALASEPKDALNNYRLGVALLQQDPPQSNDAFWAIARAISLKVPGEAQVRSYLRAQMLRYQQPICDSLLDAQLNELLALAANSPDRPASFSIPSRADLDAASKDATFQVISAGLKAGGDKAKVLWLASCGAEFPELLAKVFEATEAGDGASIKGFTAESQEATEAGTDPNVEISVAGQPAAKRLKKGDIIVFAGTLKSFTPEPFLIQLDKGKVREDTLPPEEKTPAKKAPAKRPHKKPGR